MKTKEEKEILKARRIKEIQQKLDVLEQDAKQVANKASEIIKTLSKDT